MFGRGTWAVLGLAKESLPAFTASLEDRALMIAISQLSAAAVTRHIKLDTLGVNPFSAPRLDEQREIGLDDEQLLAKYVVSDATERASEPLPATIVDFETYGSGVPQFQIHPSMPWFAFWAVSNEWKDVSDLASIKEQQAYATFERPYKFLKALDKKSVDRDTRGVTAAVRKQFPVLLDFNEGRIYIENSSKTAIQATVQLLKQLDVQIAPAAWTYKASNWTTAILNKLYAATQYQDDFVRRADESTRFSPKEIEKLEDKELESIVANFFSMTPLQNEFWAGLSSPAQVQLHATGHPIAVRSVPMATTLLAMTDEAHVLSCSVTFQERITYFSKKGEEVTFRKDVFSIDVNNQINLTDAGAAMLRGFDMPAFRKDIQREIKQTRQVPSIDQFWSNWLHQMSSAVRTIEACFREILDLDGNEESGILPMQTPVEEDLALETA